MKPIGSFRLGITVGLAAALTLTSALAQTVTRDKVGNYPATFGGASGWTAPGAGHTGQATDHALNMPVTGAGSGLVTDAAFLTAVNQAAAADQMSVVLWVKKYDIASGSAFWFASPTSNNGERAFQAHLPWSNNEIYFDTAGCCTAEDPFADPLVGQRINQSITFSDSYNLIGNNTWWTDFWHCFAFTKNGPLKQIWIDGVLFLEGAGGAAKLPTDIRALYIGSDNTGTGGIFHSLVDDLAVFSTALSPADILALSSGTLPNALPAATGLLAYWDFNDFPTEGSFVSISPADNATSAAPNLIKIVHIDGGTPWTVDNVSLTVDGAAAPITLVKAGAQATVTHVPDPVFAAHTTHKAALTYPGPGGTPKTIEWSFIVGPSTKDVLASRIGAFLGGSSFSAAGGGRTGQTADLGADFGNGTGPVHVSDATFLNALTATDELAFSFWQKKPGIEAGSAFWANSPSSADDQRGFQAHVPWSDSNVYFDTAGCCDAFTQRIYAGIATFPSFTDATWWNAWHHWVFQKKGSTKEVWIDGQMFLFGDNTNPLPTDFTELFIGASSATANRSRGVYDDFAVFGTALTEQSIAQLAGGALPTALPASDKLTAYWNFNDFPAAGMFKLIIPAPASTNARPDLVQAVHLDGTVVWDQGNLTLKIDDAPVAFSLTKSGTQSTISYMPSPWFTAGSTHKATLVYPGEGATQHTLEWQFTVGSFPTLDPDLASPIGSGDPTKPGLNARVHQVDQPGTAALGTRTHRAEQQLAGIIAPNVADLAAATDGVFSASLINWNQDFATAEIGNFQTTSTPSRPDAQIPGIPGTGFQLNDSIAAEVITYIEFPTAGLYTMGVNSDDGFKVTATDTPPVNNLALVVTGDPAAAGAYHALSGPPATSKQFTAPVSGKLVMCDPPDACTALLNATAIAGNIAVIDRGTCEFTAKIKLAREAGAIAVIIVNNQDEFSAAGIYPIEMGAGAAGYQDIPAVMITLPDGNKIKAALGSQLTASLSPDTTPALGEVDAGRGSADTLFSFIVPQAGVYPFRCVWYEGGGGANLEWFTVTSSGEKILVNDTANPAALKSFRSRTPAPPKVNLTVTRSGNNVTVTSTPQPLPEGFVLQTAPSVTGPWTTQLGANTPLTVPIGTDAAVYLRATKP